MGWSPAQNMLPRMRGKYGHFALALCNGLRRVFGVWEQHAKKNCDNMFHKSKQQLQGLIFQKFYVLFIS